MKRKRVKRTKMMMTMMKRVTLTTMRLSSQKMRTRRTKPQKMNQAEEAVGLAQKKIVTNQALETKMARTESTQATCLMLRLLSSWLAIWNPQVCTIPRQKPTTSAASLFGALVVSECATHV